MLKLVLLSLQVLASKQAYGPVATKKTYFNPYEFTKDNSCSFDQDAGIGYASVNREMFGPNCGQCLKVTGNNKAIVVKVADSFKKEDAFADIHLDQKTINYLELSKGDFVAFSPVPCAGEKIEIKTLPCENDQHRFVVTKSKDPVKKIEFSSPNGQILTLEACEKTNVFKYSQSARSDDIIMVYSRNAGSSFSQYHSSCPEVPTYQTLDHGYTPYTAQGYTTGYHTQFGAQPSSFPGSDHSLGPQSDSISTRSSVSDGAAFGSSKYPDCP